MIALIIGGYILGILLTIFVLVWYRFFYTSLIGHYKPEITMTSLLWPIALPIVFLCFGFSKLIKLIDDKKKEQLNPKTTANNRVSK